MKRFAPATERNREPILEALLKVLPERGLVLEVASGTGQHAVFFAGKLAEARPDLVWQPSDPDPESLASIEAWRQEAELENVRPALKLDATKLDWDVDHADAVVCINMIHIAPWAACAGLMRGAARLLDPGSPLVLYGPFCFDGAFTAPSNAVFDASLRASDPAWGVRDLVDVTALAGSFGLAREAVIDMPANNHVVVFRRERRVSSP
jgi:SAM-dependent methyltransferase